MTVYIFCPSSGPEPHNISHFKTISDSFSRDKYSERLKLLLYLMVK